MLFPNGSPIPFIVAGAAAAYSFWQFTPSGIFSILKHRVSKFGDPQVVFAELDTQGETVPNTAPYVLRISPNYVLLTGHGLGNRIWKRSDLRCRETLVIAGGQPALQITVNGKPGNIPVPGTAAPIITRAISSTCGSPEIRTPLNQK